MLSHRQTAVEKSISYKPQQFSSKEGDAVQYFMSTLLPSDPFLNKKMVESPIL